MLFQFLYLTHYAQVDIVKDINTGTNYYSGIDVAEIVNFNNKIYFTANDDAYNYEIWSSDGTELGTHIEIDLIPGLQGSSPKNLTVFDSILIFSAEDPSNGRELYISDGTQAGTYLVKDINPGFAGSYPREFVYHNGYIYFVATTSSHGNEIWKTDGTSSGTIRVTNISQNYEIFELTSCGNYLYFNMIHQYLYRTDGTTAGTILLKNPLGFYDLSMSLIPYNNSLYFIGNSTKRVWKSDGTISGTAIVSGSPSVCFYLSNNDARNSFTKFDSLIYFVGTPDNGYVYNLYSFNGTIFTIVKSNVDEAKLPIFSTDNYLYYLADGGYSSNYMVRSNGTSSGTVNISSNIEDVFFNYTIGDYLYYSYSDPSYNFTKLYKYNENTLSGSNISFPYSSYVKSSYGVIGDTLYFPTHHDQSSGDRLCKVSNSTNTASLVLPNFNSTVNALYGNADNHKLARKGNQVFFAADDGVHGKEPWVSDGTEVGTKLLKDIKQNYNYNSDPSCFINIGNSVYFFAKGSSSLDLYRSGGTTASTNAVSSFTNSFTPKFIVEYNGNVLFGAQYGGDITLRLYNTTTGTLQSTTINGGYNDFSKDYFLVDNNSFYLSTHQGVYTCNGNLSNIIQLLYSYEPSKIIKAGNYVVFKENLPSSGTSSIVKTNGTVASTSIIYQGSYQIADQDMLAIGNDIYFIGYSSSYGFELWKANVNTTGASMVKDVYPGYNNSSKDSKLVEFKNKLYYFAYYNSNNLGLFSSDGTAAGTTLHQNLSTDGILHNTTSIMEVFNDELLFSSSIGILFKTKGTLTSVVQLSEDSIWFDYRAIKNNKLFFYGDRGFYCYAGNEDSLRKIAGNIGFSIFHGIGIYYLAPFADKFVFEGKTNVYGSELYKTDVNNSILVNIKDSIVCDTLEFSISSFALNQPGLYSYQVSTDSSFSTFINLGGFQSSTGEDTIRFPTLGLQTSVPYYLKIVFNQNEYIAPTQFKIMPTNPSVSFVLSNNQVCDDDSSIVITGGLPVGGEYSGIGISNNILNLSQINQPGDYLISYKYQDSSYCPTKIFDTLTISEIPYINLGVDTVLCQDENILLSVNGSFYPLWSTGSTGWYIIVDTTGNGIGQTTIYCTVTTQNNCSFTDTILVTFVNCLSMEEVEKEQIKVFPNPTNQYLEIQSNFLDDDILIEIYSELGKVVFKERMEVIHNNFIRVDISSLNKGSYILKLFTSEKQFIRNIIKM